MSDLHDIESLHETLSLVYLFVDHLNLSCARRVVRTGPVSASRAMVHSVWANLPESLEEWQPRSEMYSLFQRCGVLPRFDGAVIDRVVEVIVQPATLVRTSPETGRLRSGRISGEPSLPVLSPPELLRQNVFVYEAGGSYSFSSRDNLSGARPFMFRERNVGALLAEEFIDPLAVIRNYLRVVYGVRDSWVGHYVQRWILSRFGITPHQDFRYALATICERFNEIFYGHPSPGRSDVRTRRGATVGTALLVDEIAALLVDDHPGSQLPGTLHEALPLAVGVYLFIRQRPILRHRFLALGPEALAQGLPRPEDEAVQAIPGEVDDSVRAYWLKVATHHRQCVDVLRPLEYSFMQTAMFAIQTGVDGLNFVFRGGLLPRMGAGRPIAVSGRAGSGKTALALSLLADTAGKGGFCVYFSFEEDYDSILDRLVTFNLLGNFRIEIWNERVAGEATAGTEEEEEAEAPLRQVEELLGELRATEGLLLLYRLPRTRSFALPAAIKRLGGIHTHRQRMLAIDSINALQFHVDRAAGHTARGVYRQAVFEIVEAINTQEFIGVILNESDDSRLTVLPYLADTVIELLPGSDGRGRRLQVTKSRTQNFQEGPHPYRLSERKGVVIHPSLGAIRSSLRRRVPATLSEQRGIPLPPQLAAALGPDLRELREKSSVLITGGHGTGKLLLALQLLTEPSRLLRPLTAPEGTRGWRDGPRAFFVPKHVMVVTFKTSEAKFRQMMRRHRALEERWGRIAMQNVRWYSPGATLTADQIVSELRKHLRRARRDGVPVDRILFDEADLAEPLIPLLEREPLFWPTVLELAATEALTSFFVSGHRPNQDSPLTLLNSQVDYAFHISTEPHRRPDLASATEPVEGVPADSKRRRFSLEVRELPHVLPLKVNSPVDLLMDEATGLIL